MKKLLVVLFIALVSFTSGWFVNSFFNSTSFTNITTSNGVEKIEKPLNIYAIENLADTEIKPGIFKIKNVISEESDFTSYLFSFKFEPGLNGNKKTTTGQINLPIDKEMSGKKFPLIIMLRGYVDQELYKTGDGTRRVAEYFAENGFITVAPDFLGYANSDSEAKNIFETRFQTYTTALSLIKSLDQIDKWNKKGVFLWGHSNGGQVALITLEVTGSNYPTVLWAPVSKPFPYSILYYTDEAEDKGKLIRRELAKFEVLYDVEKYSFDNYLDHIDAPLQIHQGGNDNAVPKEWSDRLIKTLEGLKKDVTYHTYPGADHNMIPSWNTVVERDIEFFKSNLVY